MSGNIGLENIKNATRNPMAVPSRTVTRLLVVKMIGNDMKTPSISNSRCGGVISRLREAENVQRLSTGVRTFKPT